MIAPAFQLKKKQYLYAGIACVLGIGLIGLLLWSVDQGSSSDNSNSSELKETNITTAGQRMNSQEVWVDRIEAENKITQQKLDALEKLLMTSVKSSAEQEDRIQQKITELEENRGEEAIPETLNLPPMSTDGNNSSSSSGIRKVILKLSNRLLPNQQGSSGKPSTDKSTIENTLPAGTFAKAILLGGVDASTVVSSQSDPRPVLLRITDHGNLPRKFKSDLKACHILASCYGDLSSERVYMRLEKLTCTERLTGEISETQVAGYVVGEDGRAGVRGIVADKAGPLIRNSLVGGFFSGMGQFFGAQQQRSFLPVGQGNGLFLQGQALAGQQLLSAGAAQGASNALEKYADFFIKRAEQLQPVLQIAAGREVDIVFTQGTRFGETSVRRSLSKIRNESRKQALQKLEGQSDSQNWLPEDPSYQDSSYQDAPDEGEPFKGEPFKGEPSQETDFNIEGDE
jgi:conjugal transfer pilus assembly protein TraB